MIDVKRISTIMMEHHFTVSSFAKMIEVSQSKVSRVLSGEQQLSAESVGLIIKNLRIHPDWIFGYAGDPNKIMYLDNLVDKDELEKERIEKQKLKDELGEVYKQLAEARKNN